VRSVQCGVAGAARKDLAVFQPLFADLIHANLKLPYLYSLLSTVCILYVECYTIQVNRDCLTELGRITGLMASKCKGIIVNLNSIVAIFPLHEGRRFK
jgi:hypothetical protein